MSQFNEVWYLRSLILRKIKMTEEPSYDQIGGSVLIRKNNTKSGLFYSPRYFHDTELPPMLSEGTKGVAIFKEVKAMNYDKKIWELCYQASDNPKPARQISESELVEKLKELFPRLPPTLDPRVIEIPLTT